ncbi:MAG: hypothetical protein D4R70_02100 [Betaproteobacteria bacterium]|nr:MAG: hypothetical protein D4R70_02100 [Betaproteobacteria bacterium]
MISPFYKLGRAVRLSVIALLATMGAAGAADGWQIAPGLWQFDADRHTEVRIFGVKKQTHHQSTRCLSAHPVNEVIASLTEKGCRVQTRVAKDDEVTLSGVGQFSFLPAQELPMSGVLQRISASHFTLSLDAGRNGLRYREVAAVTRVGDCPSASAAAPSVQKDH